MNMIRSKTMSEIIVGMKLSTLDSVLTGSQTDCPGTRIERSRAALWTWNAALIPHTVIASVTITLFLFQIAMMRKTIKSEAAVADM
jgi:hypothetical protein